MTTSSGNPFQRVSKHQTDAREVDTRFEKPKLTCQVCNKPIERSAMSMVGEWCHSDDEVVISQGSVVDKSADHVPLPSYIDAEVIDEPYT